MSGSLVYGGPNSNLFETQRTNGYVGWEDSSLLAMSKNMGVFARDPQEYPKSMTQDSMFSEIVQYAIMVDIALAVPDQAWMYQVFGPVIEVAQMNDDEVSMVTFDAPVMAPQIAEGGTFGFTDWRTTSKKSSSQFRGLGWRHGDLVRAREKGNFVIQGMIESVRRSCENAIVLNNQTIILAEKMNEMLPVANRAAPQGGYRLGTPERRMYETDLHNDERDTYRIVKGADPIARIITEARQTARRMQAELPNALIGHPSLIEAIPSDVGYRSFMAPDGSKVTVPPLLMDTADASDALRPVSAPAGFTSFEKEVSILKRDHGISLIGLSINACNAARFAKRWSDVYPASTVWSRLRGNSEQVFLWDRTRSDMDAPYHTRDLSIEAVTFVNQRNEMAEIDAYYTTSNCGRYLPNPLNANGTDFLAQGELANMARCKYAKNGMRHSTVDVRDLVNRADPWAASDAAAVYPDVAGLNQAHRDKPTTNDATKSDPYWFDLQPNNPGVANAAADAVFGNDPTFDKMKKVCTVGGGAMPFRMVIPMMGCQRTSVTSINTVESIAASAEAVILRKWSVGGRTDSAWKALVRARGHLFTLNNNAPKFDDMKGEWPKTAAYIAGGAGGGAAADQDRAEEDMVLVELLKSIDDMFPSRARSGVTGGMAAKKCTDISALHRRQLLFCLFRVDMNTTNSTIHDTLQAANSFVIPDWLQTACPEYVNKYNHGLSLPSPLRFACLVAYLTSRPCIANVWRSLDRNVRHEADYGIARLNIVHQSSPVSAIRTGHSTGRAKRTPLKLNGWQDGPHRAQFYGLVFYHSHLITKPNNIQMYRDAFPEGYVGGHDFLAWHEFEEMYQSLQAGEVPKSVIVVQYHGIHAGSPIDLVDFTRTRLPEEKPFHRGWYYDCVVRMNLLGIPSLQGRAPIGTLADVTKGLLISPIAFRSRQNHFNKAEQKFSDEKLGIGALAGIDTPEHSDLRKGYTISGMKVF